MSLIGIREGGGGLEWVVISGLPWPQPYSYNTQESVICAIHHSRVVLAGPELMVCRLTTQYNIVCALAYSLNLEIVLLGFASHDDVERLVRVFCAALNAAGHILLILVWVQPYTEGSGVSSQLRLRVGS